MHPRDARDVARLPRAPSPRRGARCGLSTSDRGLSRFLCGFSSAFNCCLTMKLGASSLAMAAAARGVTRASFATNGYGPLNCRISDSKKPSRDCGHTYQRHVATGNMHEARAGRTPGTNLSAAETDEDRIPVPTHASLGANRSAIPGAALFDGGLPVLPAKVCSDASGCLTISPPASSLTQLKSQTRASDRSDTRAQNRLGTHAAGGVQFGSAGDQQEKDTPRWSRLTFRPAAILLSAWQNGNAGKWVTVECDRPAHRDKPVAPQECGQIRTPRPSEVAPAGSIPAALTILAPGSREGANHVRPCKMPGCHPFPPAVWRCRIPPGSTKSLARLVFANVSRGELFPKPKQQHNNT